MNVAGTLKFLRDHPNLLRLFDGIPKFQRETINALVEFVDDALASGDPDSYVREVLSEARRKRETRTVRVTVVGQKEIK